MPLDVWIGPDGDLGRYISDESRRSLNGYREQPTWVEEHANLEQDTARGGYQHRQLFELVQNGADALWTEDGCTWHERKAGTGGGRIEVRLTAEYLYCADDGEPIDREGVRALMFSRLSPKRRTNQIGTFGLGFKAVLGISDAPEFFSRSGSFRFDRPRSQQQIRALVPDAGNCPVLRLAEPIDPAEYRKQDAVLRDLMAWAMNVVRLPLRRGAREDLRQQLETFPAEFLLFVLHVASLTLTDDSGAVNRVLELERVDDSYLLAEGDTTSEWRLFPRNHPLSSEGRADRRPGDDRDEVPVWWAAPVDRLDRPGKFWAFFPTETASLIPGILNAPWKTNEDRQNLLRGHYNDELITTAAQLIADELPRIQTAEDPARHLDVLPRRHESGDSDQADRLRRVLFAALGGRPVAPDQTGRLREVGDISYPPGELTPGGTMFTEPLKRWAAHPGRPVGWLHHKALTRTRLAAIQRLFEARGRTPRLIRRASVADWLEALVQRAAPTDTVQASMAAVQTAARIPRNTRRNADLGRIVLTESGGWHKPDPQALYLPFDSPFTGDGADPDSTVHPELAADEETLAALKKLGLKPPSPEARFKEIARRALGALLDADDELLEEFWRASRGLSQIDAEAIIREAAWVSPRVRTRAGHWKPLREVLMPGAIVPGDGSRDDGATVDCDFHARDRDLLGALGVANGPSVGFDFGRGPEFSEYESLQEQRYRQRSDLPHSPQRGTLEFINFKLVGPLSVLRHLSEEGAAAYTKALLSLDECFEPWVMWHTGSNRRGYPRVPCESLSIWFLKDFGRVKTPTGIVPLSDALGRHPASPAALHALLRHPNGDKIKEAFQLSDPVPDIFGEGEPTPLTDIWPGLLEHLSRDRRRTRLVPCERIRVASEDHPCVFHSGDVYMAGNVDDDERSALEYVVGALELRLGPLQVEAILERRTPAEVEERRTAVRQYQTDAERLLKAVGDDALRKGIPPTLLEFLEEGPGPLLGTEMAEAAIATYHTGALREFRRALDHLGPPVQWAGSARAVDFVRALGFSDEWAGERTPKRLPFLEIEGPRSLLYLVR